MYNPFHIRPYGYDNNIIIHFIVFTKMYTNSKTNSKLHAFNMHLRCCIIYKIFTFNIIVYLVIGSFLWKTGGGNSTSRIPGFIFMNSWRWNREFVKLNSLSWILIVEIVNSRNWNREFVRLKSWIHEAEIVNWWSWNRELIFVAVNLSMINLCTFLSKLSVSLFFVLRVF
jgi:hypothetical protein